MFPFLVALTLNLVMFLFIISLFLFLAFCTWRLITNRKHFQGDSTHTAMVCVFGTLDVAFVSFFVYHLLGVFDK